MVIRLDSLELTDEIKHQACWASLSGVYKDKRYCLVDDVWRSDCKGCPYMLGD